MHTEQGWETSGNDSISLPDIFCVCIHLLKSPFFITQSPKYQQHRQPSQAGQGGAIHVFPQLLKKECANRISKVNEHCGSGGKQHRLTILVNTENALKYR